MDRIGPLLVVIPAAPLISAVAIALLAPRLLRGIREFPAFLTIAAFGVSLIASLLLLREVTYHHDHVGPGSPSFERVVRLWTWADARDAYWQRPALPSDDPRAESPIEGGSRDFTIDIALRADALTATMLVMVTFISTLVAVFGMGYMQGDRGFWRFFAYVSLFVFSMTMLVSASNFLLLFVFWEAVGLCSYLLIGFWYGKPSAASAGKKAFLVNRVGDFGFALGLFLIWTTYGTLDFHSSARVRSDDGGSERRILDSLTTVPAGATGVAWGVLSRDAESYRHGAIGLAICLLLLVGACGKSAQFPLHVWLPDAMEGPTPVSALIHAATMVTAGIYMIARCTPLFTASPEAQVVVACVGGFTALLAALIALTQFDLKRVLAYSTVSQLGYMFLALGAGTFAGVTSGMFHLFTHAFFKALLFLGSGSVMHAMGNVIDMRRFGGLRKVMPITHWTFLIGCLALAGLPPFAGFWSKDAILGAVHDRAHALSGAHAAHDATNLAAHGRERADDGGTRVVEPGEGVWTLWTPEQAAGVYQWLYCAALLTAGLTALYTFRAFFMTFYGARQIPPEAGGHAHESPAVMTAPLVVLAVCAVSVGWFLDHSYQSDPSYLPGGRASSGNVLGDFLGYAPQLAGGAIAATRTPGRFHFDVAAISALIALGGIAFAAFLYLEDRREADMASAFLRFHWYRRMLDADSIARIRRWKSVDAVNRWADRLRLGWLARIVGRGVLVVVWVVTVPLILTQFASPYRLSQDKFYFDEIYDWTMVRPLRWIADLCAALDRWVIDGTVNMVGRIPVVTGNLMRSLHIGLLPFYAVSMALGVLVLVLARTLWGS
ncbi:MAG: NADH-quinone oxidoreductase subunit L [Planctomycetes bacterium]|nr:NADH-quinone oxidoreductase subunit L [Planctomycetota bacterium]